MGDGLDALLAPGSIAVIGASEDTNRISGRPIEYLRRFGFGGDIYPINPNRQTVQGLRSYSSCADVPGPIDLAVIAIPGESVLIALQQCAEKGVKACIIFSSGFAEVGEEGRRMQERISEIATRYGMRVLGPNCQGVVNFRSKSAISFSTSFAEGDLLEGSSAILSQSGAVAAMVYNLQKGWRSGAKYWVASGNEADVSVPELLDRVVDDPDVRVVQAYMEHIKDRSALERAARKARGVAKPILVLKAGRTPEGRRAARSHTGAVVGDDADFDAVLCQHGIVRVSDIHELAAFPLLFGQRKRARGRNVAIVSNSGGLGVMMVDHCRELGLEIAELAASTVRELEHVLPGFASVANPVDVTAQLLNDKRLLSNALPILSGDPNVDIILLGLGVMGKGYDTPTIVEDVARSNAECPQVIAVAWVGGQKGVVGELSAHDVPAFEDASLCARAVARYTEYCLSTGGMPAAGAEAVALDPGMTEDRSQGPLPLDD